MLRKLILLVLLLIALPHAPKAGEPLRGQRGVLGIVFVETSVSAPGLRLSVIAEVNTGGWSNGRLVPLTPAKPPDDGIYDFVFMADPPTAFAPMVISRLKAEGVFPHMPADLRGVRIIPGGPGEPLVCDVPATCPSEDGL